MTPDSALVQQGISIIGPIVGMEETATAALSPDQFLATAMENLRIAFAHVNLGDAQAVHALIALALALLSLRKVEINASKMDTLVKLSHDYR
jgi:hypothetical protein